MALKENSKIVFNYVKEHGDEGIVAQDIANGTGLEVRSVNGIVTAAFQRKGLMERIEGEIEQPDGSHKPAKFIRLTEAGKAFDVDAEDNAE